MDIIVSSASDKPIYQQLFEQISSQILTGKLMSGSTLPPMRTVAKELRVSIITVKKAWEMLEREGFIQTAVGRGSFVAPLEITGLTEKRELLVMQKLHKDVDYYRSMGVSLTELTTYIEKLYSEGEKNENSSHQ